MSDAVHMCLAILRCFCGLECSALTYMPDLQLHCGGFIDILKRYSHHSSLQASAQASWYVSARDSAQALAGLLLAASLQTCVKKHNVRNWSLGLGEKSMTGKGA